VKSKLAGLRLIQEASQKELEVVQRRTSTRLSGGSKSFTKNTSAWLGPRLKKIKINMPLSATVLFLLRFFGN
jgi:hypothetical protein